VSAAANIVREVEAAGGRLAVAGHRLAVSAPQPLPGPLVAELRDHKGEVLAYLTRSTNAWGADEWRDWITERGAILEHDAGLSRSEADRRAYQHAIIEWQNRNPPLVDSRVCAGCGLAMIEAATDWRPLADGATVHYGGAHGLRCWQAHGERRRAEGEAALAALGVKP